MQADVNPYQPPTADVAVPEAPDAMVLAGKGRRFATLVIDYFGFMVLGFIVGVVAGLLFGDAGMAAMQKVPDMVFGLVLLFSYYLLFEGLWGRTPGKLLLGTRVVDESGRKPSFMQVLGRTAARAIPFEPFSFFGTTGWHDSLSRTRVIRVVRR